MSICPSAAVWDISAQAREISRNFRLFMFGDPVKANLNARGDVNVAVLLQTGDNPPTEEKKGFPGLSRLEVPPLISAVCRPRNQERTGGASIRTWYWHR